MSYHRLSVKPLNVTLNTLLKRAAHVGLGVGAFTPILALANPTGGNVVAGQATIATPNANGLVINQASQAAIINWQQFSIGKGQYVQFLQPSSSSVVLNRVLGGNASSILGSLNANGQVFLVNPNGIFFGKSASLDVQGIVASTLDINNSDFLSGNYVFDKGTGATDASVVNQGNISTHNGGYVVLAGDYAENDGIIQARSGHVVLASGAKTTLTLSGNSLVNFAVNSATLAQLAGTDNTGSLIADGGTVVMTADVANALKATVVNNTGLIEAHAISKNNGAIYLTATGGNLVNSGTLDADAGHAAQAGGDIVLKADGLTDLTNTSKITATGNGADGGNLEVSGRTINVRGTATLGKGGNLLLDPTSVEIVAGNTNSNGAHSISAGENADVGLSFIQSQLADGANVTISAHTRIFAHSGVTAINGTGAGNLKFKVGAGGDVNLSGVNITIKGGLTASFGHGSFGFIQAKSVAFNNVNASSGSVALHKASTSVHGAVTKYSVLATGGDVTMTGGLGVELTSGGAANIAAIKAVGNLALGNARFGEADSHNSFTDSESVTLVGKTITDTGVVRITGDLNATASAGAMALGNEIEAHNVTLTAVGGGVTAGQIEATDALTVTDTTGNVNLGDIAAYGGALAVIDITGNMTVGIVAGHGVNLNDGAHVLSFDHSTGVGDTTVYAEGNLSLKAATIQTVGDELLLRASSAGVITVKGAMALTGQDLVLDDAEGGTINLDHAVKARSVTFEGDGQLAFIGTGPNFSVSASDGDLVLAAAIGAPGATGGVKYNVNLKDTGYGIYIQRSIFAGDTAAGAAANVTATQAGSDPHAFAKGVYVGNASNGAVTVSAAGNVTLKGHNVGVGHAISGSIGNFGAITVAAGKNVTFSASGTGSHGGAVGVQAQDAQVTTAGTKNTSILVQAGGNIKFVGKHVDVRAGNASASLENKGSGSASANVTLKAGANVIMTGGVSNSSYVNVDAGIAFASGNVAGANKKVNANANVSITAGTSIILSGQHVLVSGGYGNAEASAQGSVAGTMTATANADVTLTAKTGNITLTANNTSGLARIRTAGKAGENGYGSATGTSNHATAIAHADVTLKAGGAISLAGDSADLSVGYGAGFGTSGGHRRVAHALGSKDVATYTATDDLSLTAGVGGIALTGANSVGIFGGGGILNGATAAADGTKTQATATASGVVSLTTTGTISVVSPQLVRIFAGNSVAARTLAQGNESGSAAVTGTGDVDFTATGLITISAGQQLGLNLQRFTHSIGPDTFSYGGRGAGSRASAQGNGGNAAVNANANLNIQGGAVKLLSPTGLMTIAGGNSAAVAAQANASYGSAAVTATAGVNLAATAGNLTLSAKDFVSVRGGARAGAGALNTHSFNTGSHGFGTHGSTSHVHHTTTTFSSASAVAKGTGAKAALSGAAGVSLDAKGTLSVTQTNTGGGFIALSGGNSAASAVHAQASNGGVATVSGTAGITIKAGAVALTGLNIGIFGGRGAARGAISTETHFNQGMRSSGGGLHAVSSGYGFNFTSSPRANTATGVGATAQVSGDASVTILTGGAVRITAANGSVSIEAGDAVAQAAVVNATSGGQATLNGNANVNITGGAAGIVITAKTDLNIDGGRSAAGGRRTGGSNQVLNFSNSSHSFSFTRTFHSFADYAMATAKGSGAVADIAGNATINLTTTKAGAIVLSQTSTTGGVIGVHGGSEAAASAFAFASDGGNAALTGKSGVTISGGAVTLIGHEIVVASGRGTVAGRGSFSFHSNHGQHSGAPFSGRSSGTSFKPIPATSATGLGAQATRTGDASVNITGTAISLTAVGGDIKISNGSSEAISAHAFASNGAFAAVTANNQVNMQATAGALTMIAGGSLDLGNCCNSRGFSASATARLGGARAAVTINNGISVQATGAVTLTAGDDLTIAPAAGLNDVGASAGFKGQASFTVNDAVNIVAGGAFTAKAVNDLSIFAGDGGRDDFATAENVSGRASFQSNGGLNITAASAALSAGTEVGVFAGNGGGLLGDANVTNGATATFTTTHNLNITARNSIALTLTGKTSGGGISIEGGSSVALGAQAHASHGGGKATVNDAANLNFTVTGGTGTITVTAGKHKGAGIEIKDRDVATIYSSSGRVPLVVEAGKGGSAAITASGNVSLSAKGAIAINAGASGSLSIKAGPRLGSAAQVNASSGGKAALNAQATTAISGGTVTVTAGDNLDIVGANKVAGEFGTHSSSPRAVVNASRKGVASMLLQDGTAIVAKGALTITAGSDLDIFGGGTRSGATARGASVVAGNGSAQATLTATNGVKLTAASIALTATKGSLSIEAGSGVGEAAQVHADTRKDKAVLNVDDGIYITATGAISAKAGSSLFIEGGAFAGDGANVTAGGLGAASVNVTAGVTIKAGGAFTANAANGDLDVSAGFGAGAFASAFANGNGAVAKFNANAGVSITAATISLTAATVATAHTPGDGSISISGGNFAGGFARVNANSSGQAAYSAVSTVNLNAAGGISLSAKGGDLTIRGGANGFQQSGLASSEADFALSAFAVDGGVAKAATDTSISISAGGGLGLSAKGNIAVSGGYGEFAIVNSVFGSASAALNGGVNLKAGGNVAATAGGSIALHGGDLAGIGADMFLFEPSGAGTPPPGVVNGTVNSGVSLTAGGNVTLTATHDVSVTAGDGVNLAVGGEHLFFPSGGTSFIGHSWGGGSANLSGNLSAIVTAGRTLTVTAGAGKGGSGNILVQGLGRDPESSSGFVNNISVHGGIGGSSHAVANLSMNGNAILTAGSNIVLNAARVATVTGSSHKGNVSIVGGGIDNMRDDHAVGNVTITGSADAGLNAGHDVLFNAVGGSLIVAAARGPSNSRELLVDAHADSGSANVTGHMDAYITAGHDIATRTTLGVATVLGGGLNVTGGVGVVAAAVGSAAGVQQATATGDASLTAGDVISISGAGDLAVAGGTEGAASASVANQANSGVSNVRRVANQEAKATLSGANGVTLTFTGDGVIAGGDGNVAQTVATKGHFVFRSNSTLGITASFAVNAARNSLGAVADASTTVNGKNIAITVGGNLLVRAGSGDAVAGSVNGSSNSAVAADRANLNLNATQNLTVAVGKGVTGTASFVAGNVTTTNLAVHGGIFGAHHAGSASYGGNHLTGNVNTDLDVTAGGNIALNVHGNLNVEGGPAAGGGGEVSAGMPSNSIGLPVKNGNGGVATANISAKTTFTAGGNIGITMHGGDALFVGGLQAGSQAILGAHSSNGHPANANYNLVDSLTMKAGGAFTLVGASVAPGGVTVATEFFTVSASPLLITGGSHANLSLKDDSSVTLSGKTLNINGGHFTSSAASPINITIPAGSGGSSILLGPAHTHGNVSINLNGTITILSNSKPVVPLLSVRSPLSVSAHTLDITRENLMVAPQASGTSFGGMRSLAEIPTANPATAVLTSDQVDIDGGVLLQLDETTLSLSTLQSQSPVLSLVTIAAPAAGGDSSLVQPAATVFDPALRLSAVGSSGSCTALVLRQAGGYRCATGGK